MTGVMMTDLSACYNLWDHKIGLEKARLLGLDPAACAWVASYISGRSQSCSVDGHLSSSLKLPAYSVPLTQPTSPCDCWESHQNVCGSSQAIVAVGHFVFKCVVSSWE